MDKNSRTQNNRIICILGPTASGKSDLAIALAKKLSGEIISADSRQVYRGMDIGAGKVARDKTKAKVSHINDDRQLYDTKKNVYLSEGIPHWLLDVASPKRSYNVTHFVRDAKKAILDIKKRGKTPIICGGTGFWVQALIEGTAFPPVKPDLKLRKKLGKYTTEKLFTMLEKKDPVRAKTIDPKNKVRLIRALEICKTLGSVPPLCHSREGGNPDSWITDKTRDNKTSTLIIAINPSKEILHQRIEKRLEKRLEQGMVREVETLRADGISWKRLESFGLEYKNVALFLQKKITKETMYENILRESFQYAKRQLTWLRRWEKMGATIHWITNSEQAIVILEKNN
jgi:tRNA dimethylallyltransferase